MPSSATIPPVEFAILAVTSFWLGALHALEPGHGKMIIAAYLVGTKGRVYDAVVLGIVATITHTGSVIILGVLATVAAEFFVPDTVQRALELISGLLILFVGGWMIGVRVREAKTGVAAHAHHHHGHAHPHGHEHGHPHAGEHEHQHDLSSENTKAAPAAQKPLFAQLVALGVSGGIVPCPGAMTVLLAAVAYGRFAQGLILVVIHSIGMASVMVAIGIALVKAAGLIGTKVAESKWARIVPVISTSIITLLGAALTARAIYHIATGAPVEHHH
ncbi:MAG: hypothetical protein HRF49_03235 [bacterium]